MNKSSGKRYVVFNGRVPGIYTSWEECEEQVLGFSHAEHRSYPTHAQALAAWSSYMSKSNNAVSSQYSNHGQVQFGAGFADDKATSMFPNTGHGLRYGGGVTYAPVVETNTMDIMNTATPIEETIHNKQFLLVKNMEKWLVRCCRQLQIPDPVFTREEQRCLDGSPCWRFIVTLPSLLRSRCMLATGAYAHSEAQAREDAAFAMLSQLLETTNMGICDFNFLHAKRLQERLSKLEREFWEMSMQNTLLKQEVEHLRGNRGSLHMD